PYFPKGVEYPKGLDDTELQFLAQINFSEIPQLPFFPQSGILQFYTSELDDMYGMSSDDLRVGGNSSVIYFADIEADPTKLVTDFSFLPEFGYGPVAKPAAMHFNRKLAPISSGDYRFERCFGSLLEQIDAESNEELLREFEEWVGSGWGHKIGGYPGFTQTDPRDPRRHFWYDCLLLQMDSDEFIMWGDSGIGNFFINSGALEELDFSNVLFTWDCC
ncbi:MAG: DUF1963 domain-containing protein, partial [Cyanobacteria bacterium J06559_3]